METKLFMMVGISGSGKSHLAHLYTKLESAEVFSSDTIREELYGNETIQKNPEKVFELLHKRIKANLRKGINSVYDATNLSMKRRKAFLDSIKNIDCEKICVIVATPFKECVERDKCRVRTVGRSVIERQRAQFQCPYFYEGWDKIIIINNNNEETFYLNDTLRNLQNVSHDNPHHKNTIGKHMFLAEEYCLKRAKFAMEQAFNSNTPKKDQEFYEKESDYWIFCATAAKYHDIGKKDTKSFKDSKGKTTKIAHYYGHQNVSSYEIISHVGGGIITPSKIGFYKDYEFMRRWLSIAVLVCWHMEPLLRLKKSPKSWKKFTNIVGEDFTQLILHLNLADKNSH